MIKTPIIGQKFKLGQVVITRGANELVADSSKFAEFVLSCLKRHTAGDWGNLCKEDQEANDRALIEGDRLFSAYESEGLPKLWIITEADRSVTTILFPSEY